MLADGQHHSQKYSPFLHIQSKALVQFHALTPIHLKLSGKKMKYEKGARKEINILEQYLPLLKNQNEHFLVYRQKTSSSHFVFSQKNDLWTSADPHLIT